MWIEESVRIGDTVKVEFADFTRIPDSIGVCLLFMDDLVKIDFGDVIRFLPSISTFYVWHK